MGYQYEKDGLMPRDKYGDWCVPPEDIKMIHSKDPNRTTDGTLIATAYYYRLNRMMERFAGILGKSDDAQAFAKKAEEVKTAFNRKFLTIKKDTHEAYGGLLYPCLLYTSGRCQPWCPTGRRCLALRCLLMKPR